MKKIDQFKDFYFSYSSLNTYETCPYQFKLSYIDKVQRVGNFFSDFGGFCHSIIEKYFKDELEIWDLLDFYQKEYYNRVTIAPPSFMRNIWNSYYDAGYKFFENFNLDKTEYEIIHTEEYVKGFDRKIGIVIKPDLIFRNKVSNDIIIMDIKTSEIISKAGRLDEEKLNGYKKQIGIYVYYLWLFKNIEIKKCKLWFIRSNTFYEWEYNQYDYIEDIEWVVDTAKKIKKEKEWKARPDKFFCNVLCGVRESCPFRAE